MTETESTRDPMPLRPFGECPVFTDSGDNPLDRLIRDSKTAPEE